MKNYSNNQDVKDFAELAQCYYKAIISKIDGRFDDNTINTTLLAETKGLRNKSIFTKATDFFQRNKVTIPIVGGALMMVSGIISLCIFPPVGVALFQAGAVITAGACIIEAVERGEVDASIQYLQRMKPSSTTYDSKVNNNALSFA